MKPSYLTIALCALFLAFPAHAAEGQSQQSEISAPVKAPRVKRSEAGAKMKHVTQAHKTQECKGRCPLRPVDPQLQARARFLALLGAMNEAKRLTE